MKPQIGQLYEYHYVPEFGTDIQAIPNYTDHLAKFGSAKEISERYFELHPDGERFKVTVKTVTDTAVETNRDWYSIDEFEKTHSLLLTGKLYPIMQQTEVLKQKMILLALGWFDFNEYIPKSNWVILSGGNCYSADFLKLDDLVEGKEIQFTSRQLR